MKKLIIGIGLAALAAGCQSVYKNDGGDASLRPTIVRDVAYEQYDIKSTPVESIDNRIGLFPFLLGGPIVIGGIASHYADNVDQGFAPAKTARYAKNGAYAAACEAAKCDSIVGARYTVDYTNFFIWDEAKVRIVGYPAKLTGVEFRKAKID